MRFITKRLPPDLYVESESDRVQVIDLKGAIKPFVCHENDVETIREALESWCAQR